MPENEQTTERYVASRTVAASPAEVFALLADPGRHQETEPSDWVRDAVDAEPITAVGQVFRVNMFLEAIGGAYVMDNLVTVLEPDRAIAWLPGQVDDAGHHDPGGWTWRYDLAPTAAEVTDGIDGTGGGGTDVTLTYDWSQTPQAVRDEIGGLPPFPASFLEESLEALDRATAR